MSALNLENIQPLISIGQRRGQFAWVVYAGQFPRCDLEYENHYKLLEKRFPGFRSPRTCQPGIDNWERFDATNTLALVIAEGSSDSQDQAITDAIQASRDTAPDLLPAKVQLRWTHDTTARGAKVKEIPSASWVNGVADARKTLRQLDRLEKLAEANTESGNAAPRYVYCRIGKHYTDSYDYPAAFHRHRIQRETKAYVFVERGSDSKRWGESFNDRERFRWHGQATRRLKRSWIDGTEQVPYSVQRDFHYMGFDGFAWREEDLKPLEAPTQARAQHVASPDLRLLELDHSDLTAAKAKAAYRRLAKKHHPDMGGDVELFRQLDAAYQRVTTLLRGASR